LILPCNAVVIAGDSFTVDDAGARAQPGERINDQREAMGEIVAGTAIEPHLRAILAGNDAEAVAMNPAGRVRCNMRNQIRLANHNCNFTGSKPAFLLGSSQS